MQTILITGSGMLASALQTALDARGYKVVMLGHQELDVTNRDSVLKQVKLLRPARVFHTAALTKVDYCEQHPEEAVAVNSTGTRNVVEAADQVMANLVYFSTDYVFNGQQAWPYQEDATPAPINTYGASKLAGEKYALTYFRSTVIRTSGVFGPRSDGQPERNFFRAIADKLQRDFEPVIVVSDQLTAVTFAPHLAEMTLSLLAENAPRIAHLTSNGADSWAGWAAKVAAVLDEPMTRIQAVPAAEYLSPTRRPAYSVLASSWPTARGLQAMHPAATAITAYVKQLKARN